MKRWMALSLALVLIAIAVPAFAQQQQQADDRIVIKKSDIPPELLKQIEQGKQVEKIGSWVGLGREVGTAVNEGLKAVTEHAAEFGKTGVGMFIMFMIAWKVMGVDLLQLVVGFPIFLVGTALIAWSYNKNCITRKIPVEVTPEGKVTKYGIHVGEPDEKITHGVIYLIFLGITSAIMFG